MNLDVFSASAKIAQAFSKGGYASAAYDVKSDPCQDITSRAGFMLLLNLGLQKHGLLCLWSRQL